MQLARSNRDRLTDALLSLVFLNFCTFTDGKTIGDRLKVAKLLFLATHDLFSQQTKAFSFSFYRHRHGPFTTELYETWEELNWMGFLEVQPGPSGQLMLTEEGIKAAARYEQQLKILGNQDVLQTFRRLSDSYCQLSTDELLRRVYNMEVTPLGWQQPVRIGDTPMGAYFTGILDRQEARWSVAIDDATASAFFNEFPRAQKPQSVTDADYKEIYASALRGIRAEKAGLPAIEVGWKELREKLQGTG